MSAENGPCLKGNLIFQPSIFRGYMLVFRGVILHDVRTPIYSGGKLLFFGSLEQDMNRNVDTWKLLSGSLLLTMKIFEDAVDGRNPVNSPVDRYIVYPFIPLFFQVLYISGGCLGFLPSRVGWCCSNPQELRFSWFWEESRENSNTQCNIYCLQFG